MSLNDLPDPRPQLSWEENLKLVFERKTWEDFFLRTPCVKSSMLWGGAVGSILAAHKLRLYRGEVWKGLNALFLGFIIIFPLKFTVCANETNKKYAMMHYAMRAQGIKPLKEAPKE